MPDGILVASVAVEAAPYLIDKPYDYRVPDALSDIAARGLRVTVPFGRGNKRSEAVILSLTRTETPSPKLKTIFDALEQSPALNEEQLELAVWMSERFFCTVYDAVHACLPAGIWYREGKRMTSGKKTRYIRLNIPRDEAAELSARKKLRSPAQSEILSRLVQSGDEISQSDLLYLTGAAASVLRTLEKQGAIVIEEREIERRLKIPTPEAVTPLVLNERQTEVFGELLPLLRSDKPEAALLYGVTGSGKTSVYIRLIDETLKDGKTAIVLVPEIALTPQLMSIFISRFGDDVAVLHSGLTPGERFDEWRGIRAGRVRVAVGTRSAVFAPLENVGLIVIDEEQEHTYKSEAAPRYHAREIAKFRCARSNALLLLGSATPSVESMYKAESGVYKFVRLTHRYNEQPLPRVIVTDMKDEMRAGNAGPIGSALMRELRANIERGEQSILFINRRGASPVIACVECGLTFECPRCSVSMTHHSANARIMCHYCGYSAPTPEYCPSCGGKLKFAGAGTQKVEQTLSETLPNVKILRMDADTVSAAHSHDKILSEFRDKRVPILLGTQMVAKGLDFENVTLVGVISADMSLYVNDYRAYERTFSLITQVVGRSGRGGKPGRAVIQTMTPENSVIKLASRQDYDAFYRSEIGRRAASGHPPARDIISVNLSGESETAVMEGCARIRATLEQSLSGGASITILGPAAAPVARVNNRYRYRITIMCRNNRAVRNAVSSAVREFLRDNRSRGVTAFADVDPHE